MTGAFFVAIARQALLCLYEWTKEEFKTDNGRGKMLFLDNMHKKTENHYKKHSLTSLVKKKLSTIKKPHFKANLTYTPSYTHYPQEKR